MFTGRVEMSDAAGDVALSLRYALQRYFFWQPSQDTQGADVVRLSSVAVYPIFLNALTMFSLFVLDGSKVIVTVCFLRLVSILLTPFSKRRLLFILFSQFWQLIRGFTVKTLIALSLGVLASDVAKEALKAMAQRRMDAILRSMGIILCG